MTLTQLFLLPSAFSLSEQLEILKEQSEESLREIFGSADVSIINGDTIDNVITPLQIEQVRQLQVGVLQSPLQHKKRLIILPNIELASMPAQNALLKLLEEPPAHIQFLLTTTQLSSVLETIQSRSQIIEVTHQKSSSDEFALPQRIADVIQSYPAQQLSLSEVFKLSEEFKDRPQALLLLRAVMDFAHDQLSTHPTPKLLQVLKKAVQSTQQLEKNVNTKLVIEDYFFQFTADKK